MTVTLPLIHELSPAPDVLEALEAFGDLSGLVLLDSALVREPVGRYSFLAADPFDVVIRPRTELGDDPLAPLRAKLAPLQSDRVGDLPPFQGGAAGMFGYELGSAFERIPRAGIDEFELPDLAVGLYDWVIAWDHQRRRAWIVSQGFPLAEPDERLNRARQRLDGVRRRLEAAHTQASRSAVRQPAVQAHVSAPPLTRQRLAPQWPAPGPPGLTSNFSRDAYLRAVERTIEYIRAGDIFQANLSQRLLFPWSGHPYELARRLRSSNPAPFAGYLSFDDWSIVSASPERFVRVERGEVETRPIKGTRQRRTVPEADLFTRDELRESAKDRAENVMIVDLLRNDLSRVCAAGSIRVPQLCAVEGFQTVQHLVSEVRGRLQAGRDAWDLFGAVFPGGSITGAPKVRAMEIIAELEPTVRGPYCGSLFYVGFDGSADSSILIRTFVCRGGWIQCGVGGGIVADSDPIAEYEETLHKAAGMIRALEGDAPTERSR
jgi:para-aminobenzoate synthetase component 1